MLIAGLFMRGIAVAALGLRVTLFSLFVSSMLVINSFLSPIHVIRNAVHDVPATLVTLVTHAIRSVSPGVVTNVVQVKDIPIYVLSLLATTLIIPITRA